MSLVRPACALLAALVCCAPVVAGELRGRALVDDKPAASVTVAVVPFEEALAAARREARGEPLPSPLATALTRPDGTFLLSFAAPAGSTVRVGFSGGEITPVLLERLLESGGEDLGDVQLAKAVVLSGRVVDARGGPVVGATVTLSAGAAASSLSRVDSGSASAAVPQTATAGADGRFRFERAGQEANQLRVEAPGMATLERRGVRSGALTRPLVLALAQPLRGSVTLADRRTPAPGALVRFEGRATRTRWVESRADGSFLIDAAPAEPGTVVAIAGERGRGSQPVASGSTEPLAVALAATATLSGRVVDADAGRPLSGVRLAVRGDQRDSFVARSGADGRYRVAGLPPGRYRLSADDDRFVAWSQSLVVAGAGETRDVPLRAAASLSGRVVAEDGRPIAGALVRVSRGSEDTFTVFRRAFETQGGVRSGADGGFRVGRLAPGPNQRVDVRHDEYEPRTLAGVSLAAGALRSGLVVVLRRGLSLVGFVRDEDGHGLGGVEVTLSSTLTLRAGRGGTVMSMMGAGSEVRRETGADGRFEFAGLRAIDYTLRARRSGLSSATLDPVKVAAAGQDPVVLVLRPGAAVSGFVRDRSGVGSPGWMVFARPAAQAGPTLGPSSLRSQELTAEDGAFVVEGLAAGESYELQAMGQSGFGPRRSGVTAPAEDVELVTSGGGQIRGRVLDGESGRPVPDFELRYLPDNQGAVVRVFSTGTVGRGPYARQPFHAEDGAFVLEDVAAGRWMVEAFAKGYQNGSASGLVLAEGGALDSVEVRLARGAVVSGRVLDARSGRPVLDAAVRAEGAGAAARPSVVQLGGQRDDETTTDAEGRYEIAGLGPGGWRLTASHPDWSETSETVEVKDAAVSLDLRLGRGGTVTGTVLSGARPVAGAEVILSVAGDAGSGMASGNRTTITDEGGRFRYDHLQPGRYTLVGTLREQSSAPAEAVVTGDDPKDVQLTLAAGAVVHGTVSGLPEASLGGIQVNANGPDFFASTRTAANGGFELSGVPEGTTEIHANAGDFLRSSRSASTTVTIAPGQTEAAAEIVFEAGLRVEGRVTRRGQGISDVMVMAFPREPGSRRSGTARTDAEGSYAIEGLGEGAHEFVAHAEGSAPIHRTVTLTGDTTVDLEAPPARLAGTVVDEETGRALAEVEVRLLDQDGGQRFASAAVTDSSGRFAFEDLEPKGYRASFQRSGYQASARPVTAAEDSDLRIALRRGDGISVEARDGIFGTPLRGLFVQLRDAARALVFSGGVALDSEGRGEVPAVPPGSYELTASASGYAPLRLQAVAVPSRTLSLVLTPGGTLEIQCGPQTLGLPEANVRLLAPDGQPSLVNPYGDIIRLNGPVRRVENLPPGRYTLQLDGSSERRAVTIAEGGTATVSLP